MGRHVQKRVPCPCPAPHYSAGMYAVLPRPAEVKAASSIVAGQLQPAAMLGVERMIDARNPKVDQHWLNPILGQSFLMGPGIAMVAKQRTEAHYFPLPSDLPVI